MKFSLLEGEDWFTFPFSEHKKQSTTIQGVFFMEENWLFFHKKIRPLPPGRSASSCTSLNSYTSALVCGKDRRCIPAAQMLPRLARIELPLSPTLSIDWYEGHLPHCLIPLGTGRCQAAAVPWTFHRLGSGSHWEHFPVAIRDPGQPLGLRAQPGFA